MEASSEQRSRFGAAPGLADRIGRHIQARAMPAGVHLSVQVLADSFGASRTLVTAALRLLAARGMVRHAPRRGFFVDGRGGERRDGEGVAGDAIQDAYKALVKDRLSGALHGTIREHVLLERYALTRAQLQMLTSRAVGEGWIERRPGYGWTFTEMLTTPEAFAESFRLRRVLEPASLLEPGYRLDADVIAQCRQSELAVMRGGFETLSLEALFDQRAHFHEVLVSGSRNRYFLDTVRRVNRIRRLLSYQAMGARRRYVRQCEEHLHVLGLVEKDRNEEAAVALRDHLDSSARWYAEALVEQP